MTCHAIKPKNFKEYERDGGAREREAYDYAGISCSVLLIRCSASLPELVPLQMTVTESEKGQAGREHCGSPRPTSLLRQGHRAHGTELCPNGIARFYRERWTDPFVSSASTEKLMVPKVYLQSSRF